MNLIKIIINLFKINLKEFPKQIFQQSLNKINLIFKNIKD